MVATEVAPSALERLADSHPGLEPWWDSSPLIFDAWREETLATLQGERRTVRAEQLDRLFNRADPTSSVFVGVTSNPPLSVQAIQKDPQTWNAWTDELVRGHASATAEDLFWPTYREVVRRGAAFVRPIFDASGQRRGYLSGQVDPRVYGDLQEMVRQAIQMHQVAPNVMVKLPGTKEGIFAIELVTGMGIPTNATLVFTLPQMIQVAEAVKRGLARARATGVDLSGWRSVCTMMLGRFEDAKPMKQQAAEQGVELTESDVRWAGPAIFKKAYRLYQERGYESKCLAASMRLGPTVNGRQTVRHLEELAGGGVVATIFPNIVEAWIDGYDGQTVEPRIEQEPPADVLEKLLRIPYFRDAYDEHGLTPDQFNTHAAVQETSTSFLQASADLLAYVQERIDAVRG
ncbi:MAG: transaldolase family protein [Chloroflexota bacterium]